MRRIRIFGSSAGKRHRLFAAEYLRLRSAIYSVGGRSSAAQEPDRPDRGIRSPAHREPAVKTSPCAGRSGDMVYAQSEGSSPGIGIRRRGFTSRASPRDAQLLGLYNACECFAFPSFYEGFGLPILEAMACGRAVACSNTSAMPEVADGAGLLFDPAEVERYQARVSRHSAACGTEGPHGASGIAAGRAVQLAEEWVRDAGCLS